MKVKLWADFTGREYDQKIDPSDPCRCGILKFVLCPFCEKWGTDCDGKRPILEYQDHVSHPMIWEWPDAKNPCQTKAVINIFSRREIIPTEEDIRIDSLAENNPQEDGLKLYSCDLYKIVRISNSQLTHLQPCHRITNIRGYISDGCPQQRAWWYGLQHLIERDPDLNFVDSKLPCTLPVNSYNTEAPEIPYPENFCLDHDGTAIYLDCQDQDGKPVRVWYSGD